MLFSALLDKQIEEKDVEGIEGVEEVFPEAAVDEAALPVIQHDRH